MRNLLNFIIRNIAWFLFVGYVVVSCMLLFRNNPFQRHVYLTSAGVVTGGIYDFSSGVTNYIGLRTINEDLQQRNAALETEILALRHTNRTLREKLMQDSVNLADTLGQFDFVVASVINNSVNRPFNYITIDKGRLDGITEEMGVMDQNGVVGAVNVVGDHYARIISLLNPNFHLSCKLRSSDAFGSLVWDGKRPTEALLEELPRQVKFAKGDTIITSGYSAMFPEGIPVGVVIGSHNAATENFHTLRIRLLTDFTTLSTVKIMTNRDFAEIREVEKDPDTNE